MLQRFSVKKFQNFKMNLFGIYLLVNIILILKVSKWNCEKFGSLWENGSGKSNLTYAVMDITTHLTDFTKQENIIINI